MNAPARSVAARAPAATISIRNYAIVNAATVLTVHRSSPMAQEPVHCHPARLLVVVVEDHYGLRAATGRLLRASGFTPRCLR